MLRAVVLAGCLLTAAMPVVGGLDLHAYWDSRCKDCHGDAGAFARGTLAVEQGRLFGRHHRDNLDAFLRQHYLADDLVAPVTKMLIAQVNSAPLFKSRCSSCHGTAAEFARNSLALQDGLLTGRASRRSVAEFLRMHGGLEPAEIAAMDATLKRVLSEVSPGK